MEPNYQALQFWLSFINLMLVAAVAVYSWQNNRHKASAAQIQSLKTQVHTEMGEIDDRLIRVESDLKHLPNQTDIGNIHRRIDEVAQGQTRMEGQLGEIKNLQKTIHHHLLNGSSKR
jgi:3-keto-L-gulonate-6-phosphate decarboxylase